eukprot:TRINITY_DN10939_c0_g1_i4.p1 TRINITY_DN10939_c0_g1~~TRINITY_DN10939_c0_g1_i4.p1  ORF type:complete len:423 (-),score=113.25 TRINITY_DN10939_c0_g1_i4:53-1321(-)
MCFKIKRNTSSLAKTEEGLMLYVILKSSIFSPIIFFQPISVDQQLIVYIKLLSSFHLVLVMKPLNLIESMAEIFKGKLKYLAPLLVSFAIVVCTYLTRLHFFSQNTANEDLKVKYMIILSISLLVIFGSLSWMKSIEGIQPKKEEDPKDWLKNLNHYRLPVIALKHDYSILYANRTAKDYFAPLDKERVKTFCHQLVEFEHLDESKQKLSLANNLDYLFTLLSDISSYTASDSGSRQYVSSKKRYIMSKANPFTLAGKSAEETLFQIDIFEAERKEHTEEYLILIVSENVDAKDYKEQQSLSRLAESKVEFMAGEVARQAEEIGKILEGENPGEGDSKLVATSLKRLCCSVAVCVDLVKPEGDTVYRDVKAEHFLEEIKELFEPSIRYMGGRLLCTYLSRTSSWNIDYPCTCLLYTSPSPRD